jgi:hypothetical protein
MAFAAERNAGTNEHSRACKDQAASHDHDPDVGHWGAQRHANADLAPASTRELCHHAVDPDEREQQPGGSERKNKRHDETAAGE